MTLKLDQFKKNKIIFGAVVVVIIAISFAVYLTSSNLDNDFEVSKVELLELASDYAVVEAEIANKQNDNNLSVYFEWGNSFDFSKKTEEKKLPADQKVSEKISNLRPGKKYYFRVIVAGEERKEASRTYLFTTKFEKPKVKTVKKGNIESNRAKIIGEVLSSGGSKNVEGRFRWGVAEGLKNTTDWVRTNNVNNFSELINNLEPNKKYYYQAEIKNEAGVEAGAVENFTTKVDNPKINLDSVSGVQSNQANIQGSIISMGGARKVDVRIEWGNSETYLNNETSKISQQEPGSFSYVIDEFNPNTDYYVQAIAENSGGIKKSNVINFTTDYLLSEELRQLIIDNEGEFKAEILEVSLDNKRIKVIKNNKKYNLYYQDSTEFFLNPITERRNYVDSYLDSYEGSDCPEVPDEGLANYRLRSMKPGDIEGDEVALLIFSNYRQKDYYLSRVIVEN